MTELLSLHNSLIWVLELEEMKHWVYKRGLKAEHEFYVTYLQACYELRQLLR